MNSQELWIMIERVTFCSAKIRDVTECFWSSSTGSGLSPCRPEHGHSSRSKPHWEGMIMKKPLQEPCTGNTSRAPSSLGVVAPIVLSFVVSSHAPTRSRRIFLAHTLSDLHQTFTLFTSLDTSLFIDPDIFWAQACMSTDLALSFERLTVLSSKHSLWNTRRHLHSPNLGPRASTSKHHGQSPERLR